jgi:malic enzyme
LQGVIRTASKIKIKTTQDLYELIGESGYECIEDNIMVKPELVRELTLKRNWAAIITNGTAILGLGDIGGIYIYFLINIILNNNHNKI